MSYLFVISFCLSSLFFVLLLTAKDKNKSHYLLATFFVLASFNIAYIFLKYTLSEDLYISIITELNTTLAILYAPIIFYYAQSVIEPGFDWKRKLLPVAIGYLIYLVCFSLVIHNTAKGNILGNILYAFKPLINAFFIIKLLLYIKELQKNAFWNEKNNHFRLWLLWLAIGGLMICIISIVAFYGQDRLIKTNLDYGDYLICAFLSVYFFGLSVLTYGSGSVFRGSWVPKPNQIGTANFKKESEEYQKMLNYMELNKPHLDHNLSLAKLSELLKLPTSKVSRMINQHGNTSFFDLINTYRVEEVKSKLQNSKNDHYSLLAIAQESGFNTKASFNRTFKKYVGKTPSQFRKEILTKKQP